MPTETRAISVELPTEDDFALSYPKRARYAREEGNRLFHTVMSWESYLAAECATLRFGLPAVAGVAAACYTFVEEESDPKLRNYIKQYIGALVCCLMEANGFKKTGTKRAIPHPGFTVGEVYRLKKQGEA